MLEFIDTDTMNLLKPDMLSTLDTILLASLPQYLLPRTYSVDSGMGLGCLLDPPGYPTYFLRHVFTKSGNLPQRKAQVVIKFLGKYYVIATADSTQDEIDALIRRLWKPLPLEHPRTQAWIADMIRYYKGCYVDPRPGAGRFGTSIRVPSVDGDWSNDDILEIAQVLGIKIEGIRFYPSSEQPGVRWAVAKKMVMEMTNAATWFIRRHYPDYVFTGTPEYTGDWYSILAERPTPENCPGKIWSWGDTAHPVNSDWCQVCGWHE